jgi:hypothetical protein
MQVIWKKIIGNTPEEEEYIDWVYYRESITGGGFLRSYIPSERKSAWDVQLQLLTVRFPVYVS